MPRLTLAAAASLLALSLTAGAVHAGEAYYLLMFGSQRTPANPNHTHSFATFVRVTWDDGCMFPAGARVESLTISWLPETLRVRLLALCPEPGVNLPLHDTLRWALDDGQRVSVWGPYQVEPEVWGWAIRRRGVLESQVQYKANDAGYNSARVSNCIHAVSSVIEGPRLRVASPGWGETASYAILRRFMPYVIDCGQTHPWLIYALGLDCYPLIYRDAQSPRSGAIVGPFNRLFGGERGLTTSYGPPAR
jgi:hypothetical protein